MTPTQPEALEAVMESSRLRGRRIVITGAASGIGRATANLFAREGAALALVDRDQQGLAETARQTAGHAYNVDITDEQAVSHAIEEAAGALHGIDGVVNAAGIMPTGLLSEVPVSTWRRTLDVNLTGMYLVVRSCLRWLKEERAATIVNIASAAGLLPNAPVLPHTPLQKARSSISVGRWRRSSRPRSA